MKTSDLGYYIHISKPKSGGRDDSTPSVSVYIIVLEDGSIAGRKWHQMITTVAGKMDRQGELNEKLYVTFFRYRLDLVSRLSFLKT